MKTLFIIVTSLVLSLAVSAQTTNAPTASDWTESIKRIIELNPEAIHSTNWVVALAPSYARGLKDVDGVDREFGVTAAVLYPLGKYVYAGARVDYLANSFWLPSVGVELKADLKLFQKLTVTPFAVTGVSYAVTDNQADTEIGAIYGVGVKMHLITVKSVRLGGFLEYERWSNFPDVDIFHAGLTASFTF